MKFILNLFKGLAVFYWVLAASLFTSVLFFPSAIDGLYGVYSGVVGEPTSSEVSSSSEEISSSEGPASSSEVLSSSSEEVVSSSEEISSSEETSSSEEVASSSEEISSSEVASSSEESSLPETQPLGANPSSDSEEIVRCMAITPACGWELVVSETEVLVLSIDEELPVGVEFFISAESLLDDDLFATLLVFNVESSEWEEIQVPLSAPEVIEHESFWFDQESGIIFYAEWVDIWETGGPGPLPEEEVVLGELTREEFVLALEEILIYSAIFMLPFTILVFTVGAKLNEASSEIDPNPEVIIENKESRKKAAVRTRAIGVTRLRVRK